MLLKHNDSALLLIDVQEKLTPLVLNPEALVSRCEWLLRLGSKHNIPIIVSEQYPKGLGATVEPLKPYITQDNCIAKNHFSSAQSPDFIHLLNAHNKKQLILLGIEAHVCVMQTALELHEQGYQVYVVADAVSSRSQQDIKYGLKRMKQAGIVLITAEMVFFEWLRQAGTPEFKALSQEFFSR